MASLAAAALVAFTNAGVQWWRHRADLLAAAVDNLCEEINRAADLATDYWLQDRPDPHAVESVEARLVGRQMRLQQLMSVLQDHVLQFPMPPEALLPDLYDAMTAGEFQVRYRPRDIERAQLVQAKAAELNGALRQALAARFREMR